jgi:hypothetical protein
VAVPACSFAFRTVNKTSTAIFCVGQNHVNPREPLPVAHQSGSRNRPTVSFYSEAPFRRKFQQHGLVFDRLFPPSSTRRLESPSNICGSEGLQLLH